MSQIQVTVPPSVPSLPIAAGLKSWSYDPGSVSANTAPTAGVVYAIAVPYQVGQSISATHWYVNTAGTSTAPTHIYTGVADSAGKMLAQSNDDAANAGWTAAAPRFVSSALSASYAVTATALYYHVFLQVGSWGGTQMTLNRGNGVSTLVGSVLLNATGTTTSQTGLPANGSSIAGGLTATNALRYWSGSA